MDCGYGAQAGLPAKRLWLHGYLRSHMGREWAKVRREFSCLFLRCPMLMDVWSRTGLALVG